MNALQLENIKSAPNQKQGAEDKKNLIILLYKSTFFSFIYTVIINNILYINYVLILYNVLIYI